MDFISTSNAPPAGGHYSQAVVANGLVFVSGQLPFIPGTERQAPAGIEAQTRQALANVEQILLAAGSALNRVTMMNVYVTDIDNWPAVNRVYAEVMGEHKPARAVAVSPQLHFGSLVEIQAIAVVA